MNPLYFTFNSACLPFDYRTNETMTAITDDSQCETILPTTENIIKTIFGVVYFGVKHIYL